MPLPVRLIAVLAAGWLAGCATRRLEPVPSLTWDAAPSAVSALQSEPPLPGDPLGAWGGLETSGAGEGRMDAAQAVALALERHPELAAVAAEVRAAQRRRTAAGRLPDPELEASWLPTEQGAELEVGVAVDLTDALLAPLKRRVGDAAVDAQHARAAEAAAKLQFEVREAFYALAAGEQQLALSRRALDAQAAARDLARALLAAGNIAALDAVVQEAAYEVLRQRLAGLELEVATRREELVALLGAPTKAVAALPAPPEADAIPADLEQQALQASLELDRVCAELRGLGRAAALAGVQGLWPEVSVGLLAASEDGAPWRTGASISVGLPLFGQGGAARGALAAEFDATDARQHQLVVDITAAARTVRAQVAATHARSRHQREVVLPLQRELTEQTLLQYNAMQVGPYELLAARQAELDAEMASVEADRAYWTARAQLMALLAGVRVDAVPSPSLPTSAPAPSPGH